MNAPNDDREEILGLYAPLRVADVRDGMDWMGMHHYGTMSPAIRPLWPARACGLARTARYLPFQGPAPKLAPDEYTRWVGWYYQEVCPYPWMKLVRPGDFAVIDQSSLDVGLMGSNNALAGVRDGLRGYVTNGGVRDTDELVLQKVPFWSAMRSQPMDQARIQFDACDIPVAVGGVVVYPGDVVVADGDGVVVVPRNLARDVAKWARHNLDKDKAGRRKLYEQTGRELDDTVR